MPGIARATVRRPRSELTCANPEAPCPVPTAIVDDPPLNAVKGKTWETGVPLGLTALY